MNTDEHERLIEKLRRIESLYANVAAFPGEKVAAGEARERILARLKGFTQSEPPVEYTFNLRNPWSKQLFIALLRRYQIRPYRYARQRHTTVMARVPKRFVDETLWPEFADLERTLTAFLNEVTERVISESINADHSDVEVRAGTELPAPHSMNQNPGVGEP